MNAELKRPMNQVQGNTPPTWQGRSTLTLIKDVIGGWEQNRDKLRELRGMLHAFTHPSVVQERLERLRDRGHCDEIPSLVQLLLASRDQLSFSLGAETKEFYRAQGIPWVFHNLRRLVAFPTSMMDPVGLFSPRDTIVHHILQTFHRHPLYDLVLLRAFADGVEEMQRQLNQLAEGTHPHQRSLESLIEDGSYIERLLRDVPSFAADPHQAPRPIPEGLSDDPYLMLAMDQFKDLRGYTNYAKRVPGGRREAFVAFLQMAFNETLGSTLGVKLGPKHLRVECCDPELVRRHLGRAADSVPHLASVPAPA